MTTEVRLFGNNGNRTIAVERDDRFTNARFGKVAPAPTEPLTITPDLPAPVIEPQAILDAMTGMESDRFLIIDEILYVATAKLGLKLSLRPLKAIFDKLKADGHVEYEKNRFGQDCYRLSPPRQSLTELLAEVDALMAGGA